MPDKNEEVGRLEELNSELKRHPGAVPPILRDTRERLAANSNYDAPPEEDEESRAG